MKTKSWIGLFVIILMTVTSCNQMKNSTSKIGPVKLATELDTASYALGINMANQIKTIGMDEVNIMAFAKGFQQVIDGDKTDITVEETNPILQAYFTNLQSKQAETNLKEGQDWLAANGKKSGVITTASGLQYEVMREGTGIKPLETDTVKVHYHGTLIDGTVFDSSVDRNEPVEFPLNGVIKGWTEGVQLMSVGSKYKFFIPSELAYGANPRPGGPIEPNMVLVFEVELLDVIK
ncbi:MAG: FKBP-type peptidyl-prolyl cis-trans isomerase [Bacteroidota bacterium]